MLTSCAFSAICSWRQPYDTAFSNAISVVGVAMIMMVFGFSLNRVSVAVRDAAVVPAGTVSFSILNEGPTSHELIVVRTDRAPDKLPLQDDGLTVDQEKDGIEFLEEVEGLDIDDRQTVALDLAPGHYVLYCNLEGHYLGGMYEALIVR